MDSIQYRLQYIAVWYMYVYKAKLTHIGKMSYILVFSQQNRILRISYICSMFYLGHKILKGKGFFAKLLKIA